MMKLLKKIKRCERILVPVSITLICFLVHYSETVQIYLQYDRTAIFAGNVWRLFSGHFVHWDVEHLVWDSITFLLTGVIVLLLSRKVFYSVIIFTPLIISTYLLCINRNILFYRGLSGIDVALFCSASLLLIVKGRLKKDIFVTVFGIVAFLLMIAKIIYEIVLQSTLFVETTALYISLPQVHLLGAISSCLLFYFWHKRLLSPENHPLCRWP